VAERGKSRTAKGAVNVAYRGWTTNSLREAYLIRTPDRLGCSLFIDCTDLWKSASKLGAEDVLLSRFERGARVPRVEHPERGPFRDTTYYEIFGPTIIATNEMVPPVLESRSIQIIMEPSSKIFEDDITPEMALPLKERLVAFRARHLGEPFPKVQKPVPGRLGDITRPLLQVLKVASPDHVPILEKLVSTIGSQKSAEKAESIEGKLVQAVADLVEQEVDCKLKVERIVDRINLDQPLNRQWSSQKIGKKLRALGFRDGGKSHGKKTIIADKNTLESLMAAHGVEPPHRPHPPHDQGNQSNPGGTNGGGSGLSPTSSPGLGLTNQRAGEFGEDGEPDEGGRPGGLDAGQGREKRASTAAHNPALGDPEPLFGEGSDS